MATTITGHQATDLVTGPLEIGGQVRIRDLETAGDYASCARLQRRVWGEDYREVVPASVIKVSREVGGLCAGAFSADGELIGFVYGLTGVRSGRLVHWSHMLAVEPSHRNQGVGRQLKLHQRDAVRRLGVTTVYWTFDPLVARNAHLNLNRLGAVIEEYVPDMYPDTGSDLHAFGTDRMVAFWPVSADTAPKRAELAAVSAIPEWTGAAPADARRVRVEIPVDAESMREDSLDALRRWRERTRAAFSALMGAGWRVTGFVGDGRCCHYILERPA